MKPSTISALVALLLVFFGAGAYISTTFALVARLVLVVGAGAFVVRQDRYIKELEVYRYHARKPSPLAPLATPTPGEFEALQRAYKTSQDTLRQLHATIASERRVRRSAVEHGSRVEYIQAASDGKTSHIRQLTAAYNSLLDTNRTLERTIASTHDEMTCLRRTNAEQATTIWRLEQTAAKFNHVKELIHRLTAAGGLRMVVTVLFVGLLALDWGVDLADLGIDHLRFQSYFAFAEAALQGLISPLLPVGGFRLEGIQWPLSGLRVVGARIVEPWCTFSAAARPAFVEASAPSFVAPPVPSFVAPPAPSFVAPPSAPSFSFGAVSAPPVVASSAPAPAPTPATTTIALPSAPPAAAAPPAAPTPVAAPPPAQNRTVAAPFQRSSQVGSFGPRGSAAQSSGIAKASGAPRDRHR